MLHCNRCRVSALVVVAATLAAPSFNLAAEKAAPVPASAKPAASVDPARLTLRQVMNARLSSIRLDNAGLADALDYLRDVTKANVHVNWAALEAAGVDRGAPVTLSLRNVPVRKVLASLLAQASPNVPLAFYTQEGIIEITTRDLADAQQITRTYVVDDILVDVPDFVGPQFNLSSKSNDGGGSSGGLVSENTSDRPSGATKAERSNALVAMIQQVVRPDIWESAGGPAKISYFRGNLIVTAPRSVHEAIGGPTE
jgi:hypothetical protein